jgi:23S rRNA (pseudouridine1915-N3)-methyltransferase
MLRVSILMVGRTKEPFLREGVEFFRRRLAPYLHLSLVEVRAEREVKGLPPETIKAREGERLLSRVPERAYLTALDPQGREYTTPDFARWLARREAEARPVAFLVGGHLGLAPLVLSRAEATLALSRLTFSHELARLVLLEQLYRAMTLRAGHPYHV